MCRVEIPVRHGFNHHRFTLVDGDLPRSLYSVVDSKNIVAINSYRCHPVTISTTYWWHTTKTNKSVRFHISTSVGTKDWNVNARPDAHLFRLLDTDRALVSRLRIRCCGCQKTINILRQVEFGAIQDVGVFGGFGTLREARQQNPTHHMKITGQSRVAAKLKAAWASPSDAAPSPKKHSTHKPFWARLKA